MTAQEAYTELISIRKNREDGYLTHLSYSGKADEQEEYTIKAYSVAIEALEKQIPKKLTHEATRQRCATCPTCKNVLDKFIEIIPGQPKIRVTFANCPFCGQALDWSDNNG